MTGALLVLVPLSLLAVAVVLVLGLRSFMQEGKEARERSNRLMQWRIALQLVAVGVLFLLVLALNS